MIAKYLELYKIRYKKIKKGDKTKYIAKVPIGSTIQEVLEKVKEMQTRLTGDEYIVVPVAKSYKYVISVVVRNEGIKWRISQKNSYLEIDSKDDVNALLKALEKLQGVVQ